MSGAPERIWACMEGPMVGLFVSGGNNAGWPEYVRADLAATAEQAGYDRAIAEVVAWLREVLEPQDVDIDGWLATTIADALEAGEYRRPA